MATAVAALVLTVPFGGIRLPAPDPPTAPGPPAQVVEPSHEERVETAIEFALAQLGTPYEFGANGPDRYDCSALAASDRRTTRSMVDLCRYRREATAERRG